MRSVQMSEQAGSLLGCRVLVAPADRAAGLGWATQLARAGANVTVTHDLSSARAGDDSVGAAVDAAVLEVGIAGGAAGWHRALLQAQTPCAAVVLGEGGVLATRRWLGAGVLEVVTRDESAAVLVAAVRRTVEVTRRLRAGLRLSGPTPSRPSAPTQAVRCRAAVEAAVGRLAGGRGISPRERSVLNYLALGYPYAAIGRQLSITPRTVKMHAANLRRKVGVRSRGELLREVFGR
jgi:DNA-binding NarL/FixJ family response regulator